MAGAAPKLAFDNGGAFIRETRAEVEAYLARGSTRLRGAILLYAKAPIALALTAVSWSVNWSTQECRCFGPRTGQRFSAWVMIPWGLRSSTGR